MKSKRKKKKKDKKAKSDDDDEVENSGHSNKAESEACAPASESTEGGDSSVLPGEVANHEQSSKKKKKKKRKNEGNNSLSVEGGNETEVVDVQSTSCDGVLQITGKCPDQKLERNENKGDDTVNDMMEDSKDCEGTSSKKKKKKRKANKESEDIGEQETKKRKTSSEVEEISAQDGKSNKKKRKDKKEQLHSENTIENSGVDVGEDSNLRYSENGKKKKRKKGQEKVKDVEMENEILVTPNEVECQSKGESHSDGAEKSPSKQNKQRKPRRKKKKNDSTKVKKSIFPGSNLEDLDGYGVIKAPVEQKEKVAKKGGTAARFIDDKLKQNAILLGGGVSKKKSQSS
ncbi:hypothetical protein EGW08_018020 [Elysia chlorotica]|uniref:Uncharacterized protein n=1 Tax=Elysia chlorotica TaxID=188477 RepID=A0A3S0ZGC7_ELYCH|nr:hypothetical protein EGW08_018020 [Elysia chlorotica]